MWGPGVRTGKMGRGNGVELPVLVRVEDAEATTEALAARRDEARLLARASSAGVLRLEQVVVVAGKLARVYEACDGVSLARVREHLLTRGEAIPPRVALGLAAAVGHALEASLGLTEGERAVAAPTWLWDDVLVEPGGRVRVARLVTAPLSAPRAAGAARVVAGVALEAIAGPLPGREPPDLEVALARVTGAGAPVEVARVLSEVLLLGQASTPGGLARVLEQRAAEMQGPTLAAWAPGVVSAALRGATGTPSQTSPPLLPDATGIVPRRPAVRPSPGPSGAPLPEASRPFERGRVRLEDVDADAPTSVLRSVPGRLDALVNDVDESEATVVGIARIRDAGGAAERDLLDITGSFRAGGASVAPSPSPAPAPVAPPSPARKAPASGAVTLLAGLTAGLLLVLVGVFVMRDGGDVAPADVPAAPADVPTAPATGVAAPPGSPSEAAPDPLPVTSPGNADKGAPSPREVRPAAARPPPTPGRAVAEPAGDRRVPAAASSPAAPPPAGPAPSTVTKHAVTFVSGSPAIVSLEVDCMEGRGKGASVSIPATPTGNCRITGRTAEGGKTTVMFTVASSGTYTCFTDGARDCR
jgi:hypothetical protein